MASHINCGGGGPFTKMKVNRKVLRFVSKYSKLRYCGYYSSNNKVKCVVNIYVGDEFGMWFWCCREINSCILVKVNSK